MVYSILSLAIRADFKRKPLKNTPCRAHKAIPTTRGQMLPVSYKELFI